MSHVLHETPMISEGSTNGHKTCIPLFVSVAIESDLNL